MDRTVARIELAQEANEQEDQTIRQLFADGATFASLTAHRNSKAVRPFPISGRRH
jgi:hypothetical protein